MTLVSVIVPIYNVDKYLRRCIDSIVNQTLRDIEIILVDDGSLDSCPTICDEYALVDKRIKVIHKQNGGLSSARNSGFETCSGEWVCFIDSDDWLIDCHLSSLIESSDTNTDIIIGNYSIVDKTINKCYSVKPLIRNGLYCNGSIEENILLPLLHKGLFMSVWRNIYRRSFILNNNLAFVSERLVFAEDSLYNVQAYSQAKQIIICNSDGYIHQIVKGSLSQCYRKNLFSMCVCKYQKEYDVLRRIKGVAFAKALELTKPSLIASSLFKESLCEYKVARQNINSIICSSFSKETFCSNLKCQGKYRFIYYLAKKNCSLLIFIFSNFLSRVETSYRYVKYIKDKR